METLRILAAVLILGSLLQFLVPGHKWIFNVMLPIGVLCLLAFHWLNRRRSKA